MQHHVLNFGEPRGLPLGYKVMPEYFRELGYETHIVGKVSGSLMMIYRKSGQIYTVE